MTDQPTPDPAADPILARPAAPPSADSEGADDPVVVTTDGAVRTLRLNRPRSFNAFDLRTKDALLVALTDAAGDDGVRAVVLTGTGRAFCAGQDLHEHLELMERGDPRLSTTVAGFYNPAITLITTMAKPVLAAVNGAAAGAGAGFACACDLRIAGASASFSMAFAGVALAADSGTSYLLPRLVGSGRAARMLMLGQRVLADEALRIGLVDEVVEDGLLATRAAELAGTLAAGPTRAYGWIKAGLRHAMTADLASSLAFEERAQAELFQGADHREALAAFMARRKPVFRGR